MIKTNANYWDCECSRNYIHKKTKSYKSCDFCGAWEGEQPDSRSSEVENLIRETK